MSSTITVQETVNWAQGFVDFESLTIASGNEPTITNANVILQSIIGPPFKWNWNRGSVSFSTTSGTQDYATAVSNFGFLEGGSVTLSGSSFAFKEVKQELTSGTELGRPQSIAPQLDDNAGNITFRFLPVPDATYTVVPYFQKSAALISSLSSTWAPIPDKFQYLYSWGFLALTAAYADDDKFPMYNQKFIAHLLGAQQGLSETERNMFLETWNIITRQEALVQLKAQQGRQALGV